jgi:hypothetical protein
LLKDETTKRKPDESAKEYLVRLLKIFKLDGIVQPEEHVENERIKLRVDKDLERVLEFDSPETGFLALILTTLARMDADKETTWKKRLFCTSIAKILNCSSCHPVFSTGSDPKIYLGPWDIDKTGQGLRWPTIPYRPSSNKGLPSVESKQSKVAKCYQSLIRQFHVVEFELGELEIVKESQMWADPDLKNFSNRMTMLIPKNLDLPNGVQWFDTNGNFSTLDLDSDGIIKYPICVPSLKWDENVRIHEWELGDFGKQYCLVVFVRRPVLKEYTEKLKDKVSLLYIPLLNNEAIFVVLPLTSDEPAYVYTREVIRQWGIAHRCSFIYMLDDNVQKVSAVADSAEFPIPKSDWNCVFSMLALHADSPDGKDVAVWGLRREGSKERNSYQKRYGWTMTQCQCFVLLNLNLLKAKQIRYRDKNRPEGIQKLRPPPLHTFGPLEDYILNLECKLEGFRVLQNQFYMFSKVERSNPLYAPTTRLITSRPKPRRS